MTERVHGAPTLRAPSFNDLSASLGAGLRDMRAAPAVSFFFASVFVVVGMGIGWITYQTGQTFWLVLAVLGFPLVGSLASVGFYEISRRNAAGLPLDFRTILREVWAEKNGQLPWLATIIVVVFLFWFFLGHMIFALFLGLSPMTNVSTSLDVFWTSEGLSMIAFGSAVGAVFATVVFGLSVLGMPMLIDRDVDFMTAMLGCMGAVLRTPVVFLIWGVVVAALALVSIVPLFLGLFVTMPLLGHATWHLYQRLATS